MSDWGSGYTAQITITNTGSTTIEGWHLSFDFDKPIDNIWNAVIDSRTDNSYNISNSGYNSNIGVGESIIFGFSGMEGNVENEPTNYELNSSTDADVSDYVEIIVDETSFALTDIINGIYVTDKPVNSLCGKLLNRNKVSDFYYEVYDRHNNLLETASIDITKKWTIDRFNIDTKGKIIKINAKNHKNEIISQIITYLDNIDMEDFDCDGLLNCYEEYFNTEIDDIDTDDDGLTDFQKLYHFNYNPLKKDTDENGVYDGDEDFDCDGISNCKEHEIGTSPMSKDSDDDYLDDNLELEFGTSPVIIDTDSNGITDYDEYKLSQINCIYNNKTDNYSAVFSADKMGISYDPAVIPTIELTAGAKEILDFNIEMVKDNDLLNSSMVGYIGAAYDFSTSGTIEQATLTFKYDEKYLSDNVLNSRDFSPAIYYFDPEDMSLTKVENQIQNGNTVSVNLSHFSTYILINESDFNKFMERTIKTNGSSNGTVKNQIVFVIDKSGSTSSNDPNYIRTSLIRSFFENMGNDDSVALVGFANNSYNYSSGLTNDSAVFENAVSNFESQADSGGTYMNKGIEVAANILRNAQNGENIKKRIFVLTDGITFDTISDEYLKALKDDGIIVYTVGLGNVSEYYLKTIADATMGQYFYAKTSSDLSQVFIDFEDEINTSDKNKDGLDDGITKQICSGEITGRYGRRIFLDEEYDLIMSSRDYDTDGLKNGEEIEILYENDDPEKPYVNILSYPDLYDSDFDGYNDYIETRELSTPVMKTNYLIDNDDLLYISQYSNFESGLANEYYLNTNAAINSTERVIDVIVCGAEFSILNIMYKDLLNLLSDYALKNENNIHNFATLDLFNQYYTFVTNTHPAENVLYKKYINDVIKDIENARYQIKHDKNLSQIDKNFYRKLLNSKKMNLNSELKNVDRMEKMFKDSSRPFNFQFFNTIFTGAIITKESYDAVIDAVKADILIENYDELISQLKCCNNPDVIFGGTKGKEKYGYGKMWLDLGFTIRKSRIHQQCRRF